MWLSDLRINSERVDEGQTENNLGEDKSWKHYNGVVFFFFVFFWGGTKTEGEAKSAIVNVLAAAVVMSALTELEHQTRETIKL